MSEADFTKIVLIPIFQSFGNKVDYHGGPNERGKDLICFKEDDFGDTEVTVVQVKKTKPSAVASDRSNSFAEIITQLQQATEESIPLLSGNYQKPNKVYFITPYSINVRSLESRFAGLQNLSMKNAKVLDGERIVSTLERRLPKLAESLCGEEFIIQSTALLNLSNQDLLSALNYPLEKNIVDFYCDLDFSVGRVTSKLFFSLNFSPSQLDLKEPPLRWAAIKDAANKFSNMSGKSILHPEVKEIEKKYKLEYKKWESEENKAIVSRIWDKISEIESLFKYLIDEAGGVVNSTFALHTNHSAFSRPARELTEDEHTRLLELVHARDHLSKNYSQWFEKTEISGVVIEQIKLLITGAENHVTALRNNQVVINSISNSSLNNLIKSFGSLNKLYENLEQLFNLKASEPLYDFKIDGDVIAHVLNEYRNFVVTGADNLSHKKNNRTDIKNYFTTCHEIFSLVELVLGEKSFSQAAGVDMTQRFAVSTNTRIHLPVKEVFATGIHCAVYGEAGAGKSTTLFRYASEAARNDSESEITLWIPLTRVITADSNSEDSSNIYKLEKAVAKFLSANGNVSEQNIIPALRSKRRVVFIFDGVDEVIKRTPWITTAITELPEHYPNCQIIVSARSTGAYRELASFLGLTLLPFTTEQVEFFVRGWFKDNERLSNSVVNHLRNVPTVAEISRNPLLATVLCVLAENDVPLPRGELSMYEERMNLLLGHYDIHKKTKRLSSHHSTLISIARQLAFGLHKENLRSAPVEFLHYIINKNATQTSRLNKSKIEQAISELIDPCNVLVPMTNEGGFGFGHLRYQEFLCADELHKNRGIDPVPLLSSTWWKSVIVLFCRLHGSAEFLINDVLSKEHTVEKYYETLMAAIDTAPKDEQKRLKKLVNDHHLMDAISANISEFSDDCDSDFRIDELGMDFRPRY